MTHSRRGIPVYRRSFLCHVGFLLWFLAYMGMAQEKPQPVGSGSAAASSQVAEPISPDTVKRFAHLAPYGGHILLGGRDLQVVLAGVPSSASSSLWHAAILAAYTATANGGWKRLQALPPVDLHLGNTGESPGALAVDLSVTAQTGTATATFLYADGAHSDSLRAATYNLVPDQGRLTLLIHSVANKKASRLSPISVDTTKQPPSSSDTGLRIRPYYGVKPHSFLENSADGRSPFLPAFWLYHADAIVSVIGLKPLREEHEKDGSILLKYATKTKDQTLPFEGFEWLLGRQQTAFTYQHQSNLAQCLYGEKRPRSWPQHDPVLAYVDACSASESPTNLRLSLSDKDPGGKTTPYPVFVFDEQGRIRSYTAVFAGETVELSLPTDVPMRLASTFYGRMVEGSAEEPKVLEPGEVEKIDLLPRETGLIRVDGPDHGRAGVLALKRADGGVDILGAKDGFENGCVVLEKGKYARPVTTLETGVFLAPKWPVYCELLGGEYRIEIESGGDKNTCRLRAYPQKNYPQNIECPPHPSLDETLVMNRYTFFDLAFPGDSTRRIDLGLAPESKPSGKDISLQKTNGLWSESATDRSDWIGASYLAEPWGIERFFKSNFKYQDALASNSLNLPVLRVIDESSGVALQYFPANGELIRIFQKFKLRRPDDSVGALLDTIQTAESDGFLELGCPSMTQSLFDYELLVRRVRPDGLRLFGCPSDIGEKSLVAFWAKLSLEAEKPYILTSGSPMDVIPRGGYPRLVAKNSEEKTMDESLLLALKTQKTLATRGPIVNVSLKSTELLTISETDEISKGLKRPKATARPLSYVAQVEVERAPEPSLGRVKVEIFSDKGPVKTVDYPKTAPIPGKLTIPFYSDQAIKWLRAELTMDQTLGNDAPSLLAATNWIPVNLGNVMSQPATAPKSPAKTKRL